jgi:REP element-mobilizing transposase RayT
MNISKFDYNSFYHIYNRSIGNELLFRYEKDYEYFLDKMKRFLSPSSDIIAYCLIPNHFHLIIKINEPKDLPAGVRHWEDLPDGRKSKSIDQTLKNFFNSYTRSYNIAYKRHGRLFQHGYKFKEIKTEEYLMWLIYYIHRNPVHHHLSFKCENWVFSSYNDFINNSMSSSKFVYELFGGKDEFIELTSSLTLEYNKINLSYRYSKDNLEFVL